MPQVTRLASLLDRRRPDALGARAARLLVQPPLLRRRARSRGNARTHRCRRTLEQPDQCVQRRLAIAFLGAMTLRRDQHDALLRHAPARDAVQSRTHVVRQTGRCRIEAQLHRRRNLVDVLSTRSRRTYKTLSDGPLVDRDRRRDPDQARPFLRGAARFAGRPAFRPSPIFFASAERVLA